MEQGSMGQSRKPISGQPEFMDGNMLKGYEIEMEYASPEILIAELEKYKEDLIRYGGVDNIPDSGRKAKVSKLLDAASRRGMRWNPSTRSFGM